MPEFSDDAYVSSHIIVCLSLVYVRWLGYILMALADQ